MRFIIVKNEIVMFSSILDARILVKTSQLGSFAKAARELKIPTATLSRRVSKLEQNAEVRIFERTTRSIRTTEIGKLILASAHRIVDESDATLAEIEGFKNEPSGRLNIAAPIIFGQSMLSGAISTFLESYPLCNIALELLNKHLDLVADGYDLAVFIGRPSQMDFIARKLLTLKAGLYCRSGSEYANITKPEILEGLPFAALRPRESRHSGLTLESKSHANINVHVDIKLDSTNPLVVRDVALRNDYIFTIPDFLAKQENTLIPILKDYYTSSADIYVAYASKKHLRPAIRAFVDILVEELQDFAV